MQCNNLSRLNNLNDVPEPNCLIGLTLSNLDGL